MREAADYMIGPKNFTSFTDDSENKDPVRRVTNIKIVSNGEKLRITYYGTGFMYHMVRIMTGTLLEVGTGEREASMIRSSLQQKTEAWQDFWHRQGVCF